MCEWSPVWCSIFGACGFNVGLMLLLFGSGLLYIHYYINVHTYAHLDIVMVRDLLAKSGTFKWVGCLMPLLTIASGSTKEASWSVEEV